MVQFIADFSFSILLSSEASEESMAITKKKISMMLEPTLQKKLQSGSWVGDLQESTQPSADAAATLYISRFPSSALLFSCLGIDPLFFFFRASSY